MVALDAPLASDWFGAQASPFPPETHQVPGAGVRPYGLIWLGGDIGGRTPGSPLRMEDEGHAGGVEHAGGGVDLFVEVLGFDEGVLATPAGDDGINVGAVGGEELADMVGIDHEDALAVVEFFQILGMANLLRKKGGAGPEGARQEAGGVGGGDHGMETALVKGGVDVLGFVDDEQQGGGGTNDVGFGVTGEEGYAGLIDEAHELAFFAPTYWR